MKMFEEQLKNVKKFKTARREFHLFIKLKQLTAHRELDINQFNHFFFTHMTQTRIHFTKCVFF